MPKKRSCPDLSASLGMAAFILKLPFYLVGVTCALGALVCVVYVFLIDAFVESGGPPERGRG